MYQRGHLQTDERGVESVCDDLYERERKGRLTLACRAICLTNSGRFRSETILATVVSTSPSRSERTRKRRNINKRKQSGAEKKRKGRNQLTFAALEGDEVTFIIQWLYNDFYKIKLALTGGKGTRDSVQ